MTTSYSNLLHLKSTLSELPKSFYNKLNNSEKEIFDELLRTIEASYPANRVQKKKLEKNVANNDTIKIAVGDFQPRIVIFCLNLKKAIVNRHYRLKRFAFGLVRCLYKEAVRLSNTSLPKSGKRSRKLEQLSKDLGTSNDDIEENILKLRIQSEINRKNALKGVVKLMLLKKERSNRNYLFLEWNKALSIKLAKKQRFFQLIKSLCRSFQQKYFQNLIKSISNSRLALKVLGFSLKVALNKRLYQMFYIVISFNHPNIFKLVKSEPVLSRLPNSKNFTIENSEFIPGFNYKEFALLESPKNVNHHLKGASKNIKRATTADDEENVEDFTYEPKKTTKMIKKKKVLLRRSNDVAKINKITSNHHWVEAFALLKWKKFYFSQKPEVQNKQSLCIMVVQLIEKAAEKIQNEYKYYAFENLKMKYSLQNQSKNFKLSLGSSLIYNIIQKKNKLLSYKTFYSLKQPTYSSTSNPQVLKASKGSQSNIENLEKRTFYFYKKFKEEIKKIQLKKKIIGFVSIQNFYDTRVDKVIKEKLTALFLIIRRVHYSYLYNTFHEIKEKSIAFMIKSQGFYFILHSFFEQKMIEKKKDALSKIKGEVYGRVNVLVGSIQRIMNGSLVRKSFESIIVYSVHQQYRHQERASFLANLSEKTYFKRISSCFL